MNRKDARTLIFGIVVSLLAIYFALKNVDLTSLGDSILAADLAWMAVVLLAYVAHFWLKAMRWCDLLEPIHQTRTIEAYPVMMTGFFANNILPAHLGEFVRMYVGSKIFRISKTEVFATIVLERMLDFAVVALMFGGALISGGAISKHLIYAGYTLIVVTLSAFILLYIMLRFEPLVMRLVERMLKPMPDRFGSRIVGTLSLVTVAMHSMKSARLAVRSMVLSLLQWALVGLAIYAALRSVGVEIGIPGVVVALAATVLAVTLPAAPGFFGTIQLAFVLALAPYGIEEHVALAASIVFHLVTYLFVMAMGVLSLKNIGLKFGEIRREVHR